MTSIMMTGTSQLQRRLREVLSADQISSDPWVLRNNSKDYAWFSNVLEEALAGCCADIVVWPADGPQLAGVLASAYDTRTPVTIRGGGTGNYGQCVPLHGGLVVNTSRMDNILELGEGYARVQGGVRLVTLDRAAHAAGQEIRIYPSTYLTATVVGFVCGGSLGVGSATYGMLTDGNVLAATVYPVNDHPQPYTVQGQEELDCFIHAYGATGVIADVTVPLIPRGDWEQGLLSLPDIFSCHEFCMALLDDAGIDKRLITTLEPNVVRHFMRGRVAFRSERMNVLLMYGVGQRQRVTTLVARYGGAVETVLPADTRVRLSDFSWNHPTAWAKKADPNLTYLQVAFSARHFEEQVRAIKAEYGEEFAIHGEYARYGGEPFIGALPIFPYQGRTHLDRMIEFLEGLGMFIANPHTYVLEEGSRIDNLARLLETKRRNDPGGILNPGKVGAARGNFATPSISRRESTLGLASSRRPLGDLNG